MSLTTTWCFAYLLTRTGASDEKIALSGTLARQPHVPAGRAHPYSSALHPAPSQAGGEGAGEGMTLSLHGLDWCFTQRPTLNRFCHWK